VWTFAFRFGKRFSFACDGKRNGDRFVALDRGKPMVDLGDCGRVH
jgi:hypothetical protein